MCRSNRLSFLRVPVWIVLVMLFPACVPVSGPGSGLGGSLGGGKRIIGTIEIAGPNVFINGAEAKKGRSIYEGDTVSTGAGSSAIVRYRGGGLIQLDQNTDPWFGIRTDAATGRECIFVRVEVGQVFIDRNLHCFETPDVAGVLNSKANLLVKPQSSMLTVLSGSAETSRPPQTFVRGGEQAGFSRGELRYGPRKLSPQELREIIRWRDAYDFNPQEPAVERERNDIFDRRKPAIYPRMPRRGYEDSPLE